MPATALLPLVLLAAVAAPQPRPGPLRTFGDWTAGCDNTGVCTMASLGPEGAAFPPVTLSLTRQPGPDGGWALAFETPGDAPPAAPAAVTIDGRRFALADLSGAAAGAVAREMANGRTLAVLALRDRRLAGVSLTGAAAALRWIDAQQGRAGTVTATVATGPRDAATVPRRRPAPVIRALVANGAAATATPRQLAAMRGAAGCNLPAAAGLGPAFHALGRGATLVLLPCSTGAYNLSSALFVLRAGRVERARVDAPTGFDATPATGTDRLASVVNGRWQGGELTSFARGRGLGDCGVIQTLVWDGTALRLAEQSAMGECRGNPYFITTWRARVVRG